MPAGRVLDQFYLDARARLLDLAATFDRVDRGGGDPTDARLAKLRQALLVLLENEPGRAERLQRLFSLDYDPDWKLPQLK